MEEEIDVVVQMDNSDKTRIKVVIFSMLVAFMRLNNTFFISAGYSLNKSPQFDFSKVFSNDWFP